MKRKRLYHLEMYSMSDPTRQRKRLRGLTIGDLVNLVMAIGVLHRRLDVAQYVSISGDRMISIIEGG